MGLNLVNWATGECERSDHSDGENYRSQDAEIIVIRCCDGHPGNLLSIYIYGNRGMQRRETFPKRHRTRQHRVADAQRQRRDVRTLASAERR